MSFNSTVIQTKKDAIIEEMANYSPIEIVDDGTYDNLTQKLSIIEGIQLSEAEKRKLNSEKAMYDAIQTYVNQQIELMPKMITMMDNLVKMMDDMGKMVDKSMKILDQ